MNPDWFSQLLEHSLSLQSRLKELMEYNQNQKSVTFEDLWNCLCYAVIYS